MSTCWADFTGCRVQKSCVPSAKQQAKIGNWHAKNYLDGQMKGKKFWKPKYSWIAKTNSDGTPNFFPISCPALEPTTRTVDILGLKTDINTLQQDERPKTEGPDRISLFRARWLYLGFPRGESPSYVLNNFLSHPSLPRNLPPVFAGSSLALSPPTVH